jgi:hypothetical protein
LEKEPVAQQPQHQQRVVTLDLAVQNQLYLMAALMVVVAVDLMLLRQVLELREQ